MAALRRLRRDTGVAFAQTAVIHRWRPEWVQPDLKRSLRLSRREVRSWGKLPVAPFDVLMATKRLAGSASVGAPVDSERRHETNPASNDLASLRSGVSKPSVNQP
jgi:hypothetical protein